VTYLVIPGMNDSLDEIKKFCEWVVESLGEKTPVYFSRFHPYFKMKDIPATPLETLLAVYEIAKDVGILYPYLGNVSNENYENTICPSCKNIVIERHGFTTKISGLLDGRCEKCGKSIPIVSE